MSEEEDYYVYGPTSRSVEFTAQMPYDHDVLDALWDSVARTMTFRVTFPQSRWRRFVTGVLTFAYGWLGYRGPKPVDVVLPNMSIQRIEVSPDGISVEARMV